MLLDLAPGLEKSQTPSQNRVVTDNMQIQSYSFKMLQKALDEGRDIMLLFRVLEWH